MFDRLEPRQMTVEANTRRAGRALLGGGFTDPRKALAVQSDLAAGI